MTIEDTAGDAAKPKNLMLRYLARFDEGEVIRWAFRGLLIGAIGVLLIDLNEMNQRRALEAEASAPPVTEAPVLPPIVRGPDGETATRPDPRQNVTTDDGVLKAPMRFELRPGGVLAAEGFIDQGAEARLAAELAERGEYVRTVSLNSPGGALEDAMGMARLIRGKGLATDVADGALCASSCPLVLAGGETRSVAEKAAVGLHQFYAANDAPTGPAQAMSNAQATTARISRHLSEMGVDPALWLHALDTPPRALYYLTADEMRDYRLVTGASAVAAK